MNTAGSVLLDTNLVVTKYRPVQAEPFSLSRFRRVGKDRMGEYRMGEYRTRKY